MIYRYHQLVLEELERHGVRPTPTTRPEFVHEYVSDLYRFELRRLRGRHVRGDIPKAGYSKQIIELRKKYVLVSIPVGLWTADESTC